MARRSRGQRSPAASSHLGDDRISAAQPATRDFVDHRPPRRNGVSTSVLDGGIGNRRVRGQHLRWPPSGTAVVGIEHTIGLVAAAWSTYLYWLPCRGSMLKGSVINYYVDVGRKFSPACKQAMDGDIALVVPWTSGLNLVAMAVLGVAWLTLVVGLDRKSVV